MSDDDGSWAPFGPSGDDEPPPITEPAPVEEESPPVPIAPVEEPAPPAWDPPEPEPELPPAAFAPPAAPDPAPMAWPSPAPPAPAPPPISAWQGAPPTGFGAPQRVPGNATASLVLGIVGLVMCPLIASVAAVALGNSAKREIRQNGSLGGGSMASWGIGLGWLGIAWGVLIIVLIAAGASTSP